MQRRDLVDAIRAGLEDAIRDLLPRDITQDEWLDWGRDLTRLGWQLLDAGVRLSWGALGAGQEARDAR